MRFIHEDSGYVLQAIHLRVQLAIHLVIAVAHAHRDDAAEKIQVLIAVGVPNVLVLGVRDYQRFFVVMEHAREKVLALSQQDLFFGHV